MNTNQLGIAPQVSTLRYLTIALLLVLGCFANASAQWTTTGNDIYNSNSGNVGIGTNGAPSGSSLLEVKKSQNAATTIAIDNPFTTSGNTAFSAFVLKQNGVNRLHIASVNDNHSFLTAGTAQFWNFMNAPMVFGTNNAEQMRITAAGNVGIGVTAPDVKLQLFHASTNTNLANMQLADLGFALRNTSNTNGNMTMLSFQDAAGYGNAQIGAIQKDQTNHSADLVFLTRTNTTTYGERMRIGSTGKVGIGTAAPTAQLHLSNADGEVLRLHRNANTNGWGVAQYFALNNSSNVAVDYAQISGGITSNTAGAENGTLAFYTRGTGTIAERMRVNSLGQVGIGTQTPGYLLDVQGGMINSSQGLCIATICKTDWSQVGSQWTTSGSTINYAAGNVGIGTSSAPTRKLEVLGGNVFHQFSATAGSEFGFYTALSNNHFTSNLYFDGLWKMIGAGKGSLIATGPNNGGNAFAIYSDNTSRSANAASTLTQLVAVTMDGKLGVGTPTPSEKLHVAGNVKVTGSIDVDGNINAKYQDVAEWVESSQELVAGTVVVLDSKVSNQVIASTQSYDSRVAGVISLKPGIALGEHGEGRVLVATTGRVKVKVDASNGPIQIGDLLVTSDKEGVAMKSMPVEIGSVRLHRPGTLIGKALEPLAQGTGEILVLLSLQ